MSLINQYKTNMRKYLYCPRSHFIKEKIAVRSFNERSWFPLPLAFTSFSVNWECHSLNQFTFINAEKNLKCYTFQHALLFLLFFLRRKTVISKLHGAQSVIFKVPSSHHKNERKKVCVIEQIKFCRLHFLHMTVQ